LDRVEGTVGDIDLGFEDRVFSSLLLYNVTFQVSNRGKIVIEVSYLSILRKLNGDLDGILVVHAVDYHASL